MRVYPSVVSILILLIFASLFDEIDAFHSLSFANNGASRTSRNYKYNHIINERVNRKLFHIQHENSYNYRKGRNIFSKPNSQVLMKERLRWDPFTGEYVFAEDPKSNNMDKKKEDDEVLETLITQQSESIAKLEVKKEKKKMRNSVKYVSPEDIVLSDELFQKTKEEEMQRNVGINGSPITPDTPAMSIGDDARRLEEAKIKESMREKTKEEIEAEEEQQFLDFLQTLHGSTGQRGNGDTSWPNLTSSMLSMIRYERDMLKEKMNFSGLLPIFPNSDGNYMTNSDGNNMKCDLRIGVWTNGPSSAFGKSIFETLKYLSKQINSQVTYCDVSSMVSEKLETNEEITKLLGSLDVLLIVPDPYKNGASDSSIVNPFANIVKGLTSMKNENDNTSSVDKKSVENLISTIMNLQMCDLNEEESKDSQINEEAESLSVTKRKLKHVLLLSPLGTDRSGDFPFNIQNLQGNLDRKRGIEQSVRYLSSVYGYNYNILKVGEVPKQSMMGLIKLSEIEKEKVNLRSKLTNIQVAQGDCFQGTTSLPSINMAIIQSLTNPVTYNTTFSIVDKASGEQNSFIPLEIAPLNVDTEANLFTDPAIDGKWKDELSKLDGPELRRFEYPSSKANLEVVRQIVRAWARQYMDGEKSLVTPIFAIRTKTGVKIYFNPKKSNSVAPRFKDIKKAEKVRKKGDSLKEAMSQNKKILGESSNTKKACYLEGGLEIIVDERPTYSFKDDSRDSCIFVRVKRCAMEPNTILKAMSEKELLEDLVDELSQMI